MKVMDKSWQEIAHNLEQEVKKLVTYVDTQVVPAARKEAHVALSGMARELDKLAEKLKDEKPAEPGESGEPGKQ
jgi:hypothetical protein